MRWADKGGTRADRSLGRKGRGGVPFCPGTKGGAVKFARSKGVGMGSAFAKRHGIKYSFLAIKDNLSQVKD